MGKGFSDDSTKALEIKNHDNEGRDVSKVIYICVTSLMNDPLTKIKKVDLPPSMKIARLAE